MIAKLPQFKNIPIFQSEVEERAFWETRDSTEYVDWTKAVAVRFPNLKPSSTISPPLPSAPLEGLAEKIEALKT